MAAKNVIKLSIHGGKSNAFIVKSSVKDGVFPECADKLADYCARHSKTGFLFTGGSNCAEALAEHLARLRPRQTLRVYLSHRTDGQTCADQLATAKTIAPSTILLVTGLHDALAQNPAGALPDALRTVCKVQQTAQCGLLFCGPGMFHDPTQTGEFTAFLRETNLFGRALMLQLP